MPEVETLPEVEGEFSVENVTPPTAQDFCNGIITATCDTEFPITRQGITEIAWTYDDGNGNITSQTQNIVVRSIDSTISFDGESIVALSEGYAYQWVDCNNNNTAIEGATEYKFTPSSYGSYAVTITNDSYSTTSDCFELTALDVDNIENSILNVVLYPNPVESILQVNIGNDYNNYLIEIFDILGNKIYTSKTDRRITKLAVETLSAGIYIIRLTGEQKSVSKRFIKK